MTQPLTSLNQKTLLQIIQEVMGDLGLPQPTKVIGNTDNTVTQLLVHATRVGEDLMERGNQIEGWPQLVEEYTFYLNGLGGITGTLTEGSPVITNMSSTAGIQVGMVATDVLLMPYGATVLSVNTETSSVTLNQNATTSGTDDNFSFGMEYYPIPSDCDHFITQTGWDRSFRWQLVGPLSPQEWQVLKSGISPTGPRLRWRLKAGNIYVNPIPASADLLVMEYYSNAWCQSTAGVPQTAWAADTDMPRLQDRLFTLGILDRFLNRKGFDSSVAHDDYEKAVAIAMSRASGMRALPINARAQPPVLLGSANVPDTGYGS